MLNAVTTKVEIDVMQAAEADAAFQLAAIHKMPAVVVAPQLMDAAIALRVKRRGQFKLITTLDWPKGENFGDIKMRGMTSAMMDADGFEVMLTPARTEAESRNEARAISKFVNTNLNRGKQVRFVLHAAGRPEAELLRCASVMKDLPTPALLRTDMHTKLQASKASAKAHQVLVEKLRVVYSGPLKLSGNIDSARTIAECLQPSNGTVYFAVNLQQAQALISDLKRQPDLRELLGASREQPSPDPA